MPDRADVVVIGAGHNGLVAATLLARAGLDVLVVEAADSVGGAARTERPFRHVPGLGQSTGAYLLGLMPPELMRLLGIELPLHRRDPHYLLPGPAGRALILGADEAANRRAVEGRFGAADGRALAALGTELAALREDLAPAWLASPLTLEETAERYVRSALRDSFISLCRGSVVDYLDRFGFASELLTAMFVVTDGLSGLSGGPDTPGSGHNFLVHNMGRLPGSDGTWMVVGGGMGMVTATLADAARRAGARIATGTPVAAISFAAGAASGVVLDGSDEIGAAAVLGACDPFRLAALAGPDRLPTELRARLDRLRRPGTSLKVNLALRDLPRFAGLPDSAPNPHGATVHLLPDPEHPLASLRAMAAEVRAGALPGRPAIELYTHTAVDRSLQDDEGHHSAAFFVQSVPYALAGAAGGAGWEQALPGYVDRLLGICDEFAPGTAGLVADVFALPPPAIEAHFGITGGHIHHVDNTVAFADRVPYATGVDGLYAGSAGCHPAGSVIGAAGHNAAWRVLADFGRPTPSGL